MSYIGQTLPADTFQGFVTDRFTGDGTANKTFTLSKTPANESAILVTIDGVVQEATDDFTVSGTTLTLVGTAANGSEVNAIHMGGVLPIGQAASLDLNGASDQLILDADGDSTISADTDDQIDFKLGGVDEMTMSSSGIVINEGSNDRDFRIEGNGNTHALFIRGSDDHVGINEDAPDCRFHIKETNDASFSIDNFTNIDNSILKLENASTTNDAFVNMSFRTGDGMDLFFGGVQDSSDGNGGAFVFGRQDSTDVELLRITTDGNATFASGVVDSSTADLKIYSSDSSHCGIRFANSAAVPITNTGGSSDGSFVFGSGSYRWATFYATSGSINTSDRNEKQDIEEITDAEKRVAVVAKGLLRKYKFKDAVEKKGDKARTHFGIIAQDLEDAFTAEGLDASKYGMFCSDTWWQTEDDSFDTQEEAPEGATKRTRLGVRYSELLTFIIGGI